MAVEVLPFPAQSHIHESLFTSELCRTETSGSWIMPPKSLNNPKPFCTWSLHYHSSNNERHLWAYCAGRVIVSTPLAMLPLHIWQNVWATNWP